MTYKLNYLPEAGGMRPTMFQGSVNGTHLGRLGLYNPSNNIGLNHPYSLQPVKPIANRSLNGRM